MRTGLAIVMALTGIAALAATPTDDAQTERRCGSANDGFPKSSLVQVVDGSTIDIRLPDDWRVFIKGDNDHWRIDQKARVTCTCESGAGGCSPVLVNGSAGCQMTTCNSCNKSGARVALPFRVDDEGIQLATSEDLKTLPRFNAQMLEVPDVRAAISGWHRAFGNDAKTGVSAGNDMVMVKIFGHIAAIESRSDVDLGKSAEIRPMAAMGLAMSEPIFVDKARVTCKCETAGSCKHESEWGVHWCDATACSSCSMDY